MTKLRRNKKGFTLAELLIVIAIIGILVAIAMPIFRSQVDNAEKMVVQANCRTVLSQASVEILDKGYFTDDKGDKITSNVKDYVYDGKTFRATYTPSASSIEVACQAPGYTDVTSSTHAPRSIKPATNP